MKNNKQIYRSPVVAALWSVFIPGFGQFYIRDYFIGLVLIIFEIGLNVFSHLNMAIYYSFIGEFDRAASIVNMQYGLFYPSVYVYNIWHAYNGAVEINRELREQGVKKPQKLVSLTGSLYCFGLGMFFGLHFHFFDSIALFHSPVFNGLLTGTFGGLVGLLIEMLLTNKKVSRRTL